VHWLYLLIALILMTVMFVMPMPGWLAIVLLLASLGFGLAWILGWLSTRISSGARNDAQILSPEDLRLMREQAAARKLAAQSPGEPDDSV